MKQSVRISLTIAAVAILAVGIFFISRGSREIRRQTACNDAVIEILDSARLSFVSVDDVKNYLKHGYGPYEGQRMDSVNLKKIEDLLRSKSAVGGCEAYMTKDGILHIELTQREPMIRFMTPQGGFYADVSGVIFPIQGNALPDVPVVQGNIPINVDEDYKGEPQSEKEKYWLNGIIDMFRFMKKDKFWSTAVKKVDVNDDGALVITPKKGKEQFIFGHPDDYMDKFSRMEDYYRYIMPSKDSGYYKIVDVRYDGRIVCKQK